MLKEFLMLYYIVGYRKSFFPLFSDIFYENHEVIFQFLMFRPEFMRVI